MTLVRWSPMRDLSTVQHQMDRLFANVLREGAEPSGESLLYPAVDVIETENGYVVRAEIPGMTPEDIKVHLVENVLTIKGAKQGERSEAKVNFLHCERMFGAFERSFTLGSPILQDEITARYQDGVLEVTLTKTAEATLKEIKVEAGARS